MPAIDKYLHAMVQYGASDLHYSTGCKPCLRKDGSIAALVNEDVVDAQVAKTTLYEIMPKRNEEEFNETNDTDFAYELPGIARFRCNVFRDNRGVGAVLRIIPSEILTAEQLGLPEVCKKFCTLNKGLVLVTGPTGSGKSTTLAAMIDEINSTRKDHIITIEDPIEFVHKNKRCLINQREVHQHTTSFKRALRAALREDPDIVLVGEMRDLETTHIAIETAETGHLVFGTLHTTTAMSTVDRLVDQFPHEQQQQIRIMLSSTLKGVIAQNLLKKKGGGRVAALEVLVCNPAVSALIREGKTSQLMSIMQTGKKEGMTLLNDQLVDLVKKGTVEAQEAWMKAVDKDALIRGFQQAGIQFAPPDGAAE